MKKKILVVDDDASVRESLKNVLLDAGYAVAVAANGVQGEAHLSSEPFDLLILDLNMPDRDGWDVLGFTGANNPMLPVILITGMFNQLDSVMIPGISVLLKKPIDVPPLLRCVEDLLSQSIQERMEKAQVGSPSSSWSR